MHIQKLKNKVLQLAMQGRLVTQNSNDESATVLIDEIREEKARLVKEKKIRKLNLIPEITDKEKPFNIPVSWKWVRFQDVLDVRDGTHDTPKYIDAGIPLITSKNLVNGNICFNNIKYISIDDHKKISERSKVENDDILFAMIGTIGNPVIVNENLEFSIKNVALFKYYKKGSINPKYLYYYLCFCQEDMKKKSSGGVQSFVSLTFLRNYIIPLPSLEEQERIVKRVEMIFTLIEELSEDKNKLLKTINLVRKAILKEAIRGKLVSQNINDESASNLLENIRKEKERLIEKGEIKRVKSLPSIKEEEMLYELPKGWEWSRLGNASLIIMGQSPKGDSVNDKEGVEFHQGKTSFGEKYLKSSDKYTISPNKMSKKGDVLLSVRAPVGTLNITDREVCIGRGLCAISSLGNIETEFYFYIVSAFEDYLHERSTGTTFLAVKASVVNEMVIPIPPLNEQKRIVKKISTLMNLCDEIESQISDSEIMTL